MSDIEAFKKALIELQPALTAWGDFVSKTVKRLAEENGILLQMTAQREKEIASAVGKLSRKAYVNPLEQMTDLVGVRAVCLLSLDVRRLAELVETTVSWDATLVRDPEEEAQKSPNEFGYQSVHFEIRPSARFTCGTIEIPEHICCELQIRTLMQHAFAEVVHSNIYKSSYTAPTKAVRFVSSSAALIETADHLFCETMNLLQKENENRGEFLSQLTALYDAKISHSSGKDQKFNMVVIKHFEKRISNDTTKHIEELLKSKPYIAPRIRERSKSNSFWLQPVAVLSYWLAEEDPSDTKFEWPFAESEDALALVYSDLGKSFHQA